MSRRCVGSVCFYRLLFALILSATSLARAQDVASSEPSCPNAESGPAAQTDSKSRATADAKHVTLQYVTPRYFAAVVIHPDVLLRSPSGRMMPIEMLQSLVMSDPPIDLSQVDELLLLFGMDRSFEPVFGAVCHFKKSCPREAIMAHLEPIAAEPRNGMPVVYRVRQIDGAHAALPDDRTLIVSAENELRDMLFGRRASGPLARQLESLDCDAAVTALWALAPVRGLQYLALSALESSSPEVEEIAAVAELLSAAELDLRLNPEAEVRLVLKAEGEDSVAELEQRFDRALAAAGRRLEAEIFPGRDGERSPPADRELRYLRRLASQLIGAVERRRDDDYLELRVKGDALVAASVGVVVADCLSGDSGHDPSLQAMRKSQSNLQRIGEGLTEYHRLHHKLPHPSNDRDGKPLLSWRVHLLPFVGEQELYERFHLDEPWDSEHNRALLSQMPDTYRNMEPVRGETTTYLLATGPAALYSPGKTVSLDDLDLGNTATILVVEANSARSIAWTKPGDFAFDPRDIFAGLGGQRKGGFLALMAGGTVDFIDFTTSPDKVRELFRPKMKETAEE